MNRYYKYAQSFFIHSQHPMDISLNSKQKRATKAKQATPTYIYILILSLYVYEYIYILPVCTFSLNTLSMDIQHTTTQNQAQISSPAFLK